MDIPAVRKERDPRTADDAIGLDRNRPVLNVGVTGHRLDRLGMDRVDAVRATMIDAMARIEQAVAVSRSGNSVLRLVTALAEGADSIAADVAVARGWMLDTVLPFARDEYARDYASEPARAAFTAQLAASHAIFELPGARDAAGDGPAYERAGRILLSQSDILIAVWDGDVARGRGGAAQVVAEAVLQDIPVIHIDPAGDGAPVLLWEGLIDHDLGQQTIDTVPRGAIVALGGLIADLVTAPAAPDDARMLRGCTPEKGRRTNLGLAYPLLLAAMGVRRLRGADFRSADPRRATAPIERLCTGPSVAADEFCERLSGMVAPRFARADIAATQFAQLFRSSYVANFSLAALAVVLSLAGLALPPQLKPLLIVLEFGTIASILLLTRTGRRRGWHRRWLEHRQLAERLRCLALSAQLGELSLRGGGQDSGGWVDWYVRATARDLGLPCARVDEPYLARVRANLRRLLDDQMSYLAADARRMHRLDHRLHRLGTVLFALTAITCAGAFLVEGVLHMIGIELAGIDFEVATGATIASATLPAIGAAIYGIRMQGDFSGIAERNHALAQQLASLRHAVDHDELGFDMLRRRVARATALLTEDLAHWRQTYHARPLSLPG